MKRFLIGAAYGLQVLAVAWGLWYVTQPHAAVATMDVIQEVAFRKKIANGDDRSYVLARLGPPVAQGHSLRRDEVGDLVMWTLDAYAPAPGDNSWMVITYDEKNQVVNVLRDPTK